MHYSIIINPFAGNGEAKNAWQQIKGQLDQENIQYRYQLIKEAGDAEYLATKISQETPAQPLTVIVVGGDGTLHDVLNGLIKSVPSYSKQIPLAYIPVGVNNDFAKGYGISLDPLKALQQILEAKQKYRITIGHYRDTIKGQDRYFFDSLGIGFDAAITSQANRKKGKKRALSRRAYLRHAISVLYDQQPFTLMVQQQGSRDFFKKAYIVIIANQPYMGGRFKIAPNTSLNESSLDLIVAERKNWLITFWQVWQFVHGRLADSRFAKHFHGKDFHCTTTSLEFGQVDGKEIGNQFMDLLISTASYPFYQQPLKK
ncbi:MAG: diacylglycerol/lipid kinase family protein [Limosilactobacillus sp.]